MKREITGRDIRNLRKRTRMTQTEFAKKIGLSGQWWLSKIENGKAPVSRHLRAAYLLLREKYARTRIPHGQTISPSLGTRNP